MDGVEVKQANDPAAGKGLFATKDFTPGDAVGSLSRPWLAELDSQYMQDTCAWCFRRADPPDIIRNAMRGPPTGLTVSACARCKQARYCSKDCQTKAWKRDHKYECNILAKPEVSRLPNICRATIKVLGRIQSNPANELDDASLQLLLFPPAALDKEESKARMDLLKLQDYQRYEDITVLAQGVWKYCGEPQFKNVQDSEAVVRALMFNIADFDLISFNHFELGDPLNAASLGIGFDHTLCRANHSCNPNAVLIFGQPRMFLRALRPIKRGEEIFVRYTDITAPRIVRREHLKFSYLFDCFCSQCKLGMVPLTDGFAKTPEQLDPPFVKVADNLVKRHEKDLARYEDSRIPDPVVRKRLAGIHAEGFFVTEHEDLATDDQVRDTLKLCLNSGLWPIYRQPVPDLLRLRFVNCLASQRAYPAWRIGIKNFFESTVLHNPQPFSPDRMVDAWALCVLTQTMTMPENPGYSSELLEETRVAGLDLMIVAIGFMLEVYDNIDRSYGRASPFGRAVTQAFDQLASPPGFSISWFREQVKQMWPKLEVVAKSVDVLAI